MICTTYFLTFFSELIPPTGKYNISGVPSILLFRNGKEYKRIMGIIPAYNLKMIYERDIK